MIVSEQRRIRQIRSAHHSPDCNPLRLMLVLNSPSPHQVDLLNALSERDDVQPSVAYAFTHNPARTWGAPKPNLPWTHLPTSVRDIVTGRLRKWVLSQNVDAWVVTSVYTSLTTQYLARLLTSIGACWAYMGEPPRPQVGLRGLIRNRLVTSVVRKAHGIIGTGNRASDIYSAYCSHDKKCASVPYYINADCFLRIPLPQKPARGEKVRFVISAQLIQRKGIDVLLKACELLPDDGWELDIYGDGPLKNALIEQARRTGKPVRFVGTVDYAKRAEVFSGRHCFVFSTRWDGWGMVIPEAMAAGLPVVSTDQVMSAHDFIEHGVNGYIGPADDAEFLARSMRNFIDQPARIPLFAAAARSAIAGYRPEVGAERLIQFVRELCTAHETKSLK